MAESFALLPGTLLNDRFLIKTTIGVGGNGIIYQAWDNKLHTTVAIKECFPSGLVSRSPGQTGVTVVNNSAGEKEFNEKVNHLLGEGKVMAKFHDNEHIVQVFDYFKANRTAYLVMEYLEDACNLTKYMQSHELSVEESVNIIMEICSILKLMHRENIIHRDINPNNIMIRRNGKAVLIDFGTARAQFGELSKDTIIGLTHGYAPVEQYQTKGHQGPWTDIYALCATLYTMLTGQKPEQSTDRLKEDTLLSPMEINTKVPEWLNRTIMAGMATDYHLRLQNVDELLRGLNQKKKVLYSVELVKKQKRQKIASRAGAIVVLLIGIAGFAAYYAYSHAWYVEDGTISVWLPDNALGASMRESADKYEMRYEGKKIEISLINEMLYSNQLSQAAEEGNLPDVFIAPYTDFSPADSLADVSGLLRELGDDNHCLINQNTDYLSEKKMVPLSFNTIVLYENTSVSDSIDAPYHLSAKMDLDQTTPSGDKKHTVFEKSSPFVHAVITPVNGSDGIQNALDEFTSAKKQTIPYYIGSTSERRTVQKALAGYNEIYGVSKGNTMYAELCDVLYISRQGYHDKQALIRLWIRYLLSEDVQSDMYLQNDKPLPIERNAYTSYIDIINSLSFLMDEYEHFEIVRQSEV